MVTIDGPSSSAIETGLDWSTAGTAGHRSIRLLRGANGRRRSVPFAVVAKSNPWVLGCVNERAGLASLVPIHVYRPDPAGRDGYRERVRPGSQGDGAGLALLLDQPESLLSGRRFRRRIAGDFLVEGNAFAEYLYSGGLVTGLRWQPWADIEPVYSEDGLRLEAVKVPVTRNTSPLGFTAGPTRIIDIADGIHFTIGDDTNGPLGVSPLAALHATHALHEAAWRFAGAYLENGMWPSGVVELPANATVAQAQLTRELINELHAGVDKAGKPGIIGFGTWKQVTATPDGAKLVELAKASREEVGAAYRMPWIGNAAEMNRATAQVQRQSFIRDVVGEDVSVIETELNAQLIAPRRRWSQAGVFVESQLAQLLRPDMEAMSKVLNTEVGGPVMTANEGRRLLGLPPLDDENADKLQLNPGTPGTAGASTEEPPEDDDE